MPFNEKTGVNSALGIAPKTEAFIKKAAMSDMLEIEVAEIDARTEQGVKYRVFKVEAPPDLT